VHLSCFRSLPGQSIPPFRKRSSLRHQIQDTRFLEPDIHRTCLLVTTRQGIRSGQKEINQLRVVACKTTAYALGVEPLFSPSVDYFAKLYQGALQHRQNSASRVTRFPPRRSAVGPFVSALRGRISPPGGIFCRRCGQELQRRKNVHPENVLDLGVCRYCSCSSRHRAGF